MRYQVIILLSYEFMMAFPFFRDDPIYDELNPITVYKSNIFARV